MLVLYFYKLVIGVHNSKVLYTVTVNCGYPNLLPRLENAPAIRIEDYDGIPLEGTNITFSCPPGAVLNGPNLATCAENGRWELYLNGLTCAITKGYVYILYSCMVPP